MMSERRKSLILGIVVNSYNIPSELLPDDRVNTPEVLRAKGPCPFTDGRAGAKCINEFCCQPKPRANSKDNCLLLSEDEETGRRKAVEALYHLGLVPGKNYAAFLRAA